MGPYSVIDVAPSGDSTSSVSVVKERTVSNGVTVSRLKSGEFALSVHDGDRRAIIELSADELREFATRLVAWAA